MTAAGDTGRHHYTHPPRLIFIFNVGSVPRFPVVGRGRSTGDFELQSSSRIESEVVGQVKQNWGGRCESIPENCLVTVFCSWWYGYGSGSRRERVRRAGSDEEVTQDEENSSP